MLAVWALFDDGDLANSFVLIQKLADFLEANFEFKGDSGTHVEVLAPKLKTEKASIAMCDRGLLYLAALGVHVMHTRIYLSW